MAEFTNSLQENIITLLAFDKDSAQIIVENVTPKMFSNPYYQRIAELSINFYQEFKDSPNEHLPDLLEPELQDSTKSEIYTKILESMYENKDSLHSKFVLSGLNKFIKTQNIKEALRGAVEALQNGDIDGAENLLESSRKQRINLFEPGTFLFKDKNRTLDFLDTQEANLIYTGIKELDDLELCPCPGELYTFMARASAGKSWFLIHLAKYALLQRKKILHITLELDEDRLKARYMQNFFSIAMTNNKELLQLQNTYFTKTNHGYVSDINLKDIPTIKSMKDNNIRSYLQDKIEQIRSPKLLIKFFPTGTLSIKGLRSYLDTLEGYENFIPDIILLDYLDLMDIDSTNLRIDLGRTCVDLRGIAGERNIAVVTVAQTSKMAEGVSLLTRKSLAEDFSKVRTSDNLITYTQTPSEYKRGLARLYVDKARNTRQGDVLLISQNYSFGQFCLSSSYMKNNEYWGILADKGFLDK
jgi:hypothetical protein